MSQFASVRASQPRDISPFVCPKKAAEYFAVSLRYLEQQRARGEGPRYRRHCRRISYQKDDLNLWSESASGPSGKG